MIKRGIAGVFVIIALVAGLGAGEVVSRRLGAARGLQLVIAVALAGGVATVVRGLAEL